MSSTKILVVDDEAGARALLQVWLEDVGHEVYTAADGWDALQLFSQQLPTLTIVDMRMPGMDGFRLIRHIREISDAHVLALTALSGPEHLIRGLELGADEYVIKPVARREFLARVHSLLRRAQPPSAAPMEYSDSFLTLNLLTHEGSRVPGSGVRGRGSGERETTASSLAGKQQAREKEDNGGQGKDGPAGAIAQGGNGR